MTPVSHALGPTVLWAASNFTPSLPQYLDHASTRSPEVASKLANQGKSPLLSQLESSSVMSLLEKQGSPLDYEESYYSNMYRQLANRYNPQYKNKKPVHVAINQRTVNGLLSLLLLFVVSVCGSTGAVLIISSLTVIESLQTRNNCYLVSLALANLFVTLLVIPTSALQIMTGDSLDGQKLCHYQWLLLEHCLIVSQLSFFLMAADNYLGYQCSQRLAIAPSNVATSCKLNQDLCNLLLCDDPLPKSTTVMLAKTAEHHHHLQPTPAASDTDVLLNNTTGFWPSDSKGEMSRPGLLGYRFCCGRLKVPVWIICTWLIAIICTLHQHESRYGREFCSPSAGQSQRPQASNLSQSHLEPSMVSYTSQELQIPGERGVASRVTRSFVNEAETQSFFERTKHSPKTGSAFSEPEASVTTAKPFTLNGGDVKLLLSGRPVYKHPAKQESRYSFGNAPDRCHGNKCRLVVASVTDPNKATRVARSGVEGEITSSIPSQDDSYKQQLLSILPIRLSSEMMEPKEYGISLQELVHHTWAPSFNGSTHRPKHKKVHHSHPQSSKERDLAELFMNNNNSNDDNNVARMQIARKQRAAMYIGFTNEATGNSHFSPNGDLLQHPIHTRARQINKSHEVEQQLATRVRSLAGSTNSIASNNSPVKQWQTGEYSIASAQLNPSNTSTTSGDPQPVPHNRRHWLLLLMISSLSSLCSALLFAGAYMKMKEFKMRPYKPMPVEAMNALMATLLRPNAPSISPCSSSTSRLTPEMTPLKHPHWPSSQINSARPTSALPPLDPLTWPSSISTLRSVSQPCGTTSDVYKRPKVKPIGSSSTQQQHRQLNQTHSAPGGPRALFPAPYLSAPIELPPANRNTRPEHAQSFRRHPAPAVLSSLPTNEQVGWQRPQVTGGLMSQHESSYDSELPTLERHRSLPPQTRATRWATRQDKRLNLEEQSQLKSGKVVKVAGGADQLCVPGCESNNNNGGTRGAASQSSRGGQRPEVGIDASKVAVEGKQQQYNRAIICTYSYMTDEQLLKSNIIAFLVNLTLWLPLILLIVVIEPRQPLQTPHHLPTQELKDFVWWMATLNCCSCSYVYALTNKDFREAFNKLFYYCCCKSHVTFQRKTPIFRRQLDLDPQCNLRVHIIPGLNQFSSKLSRPQ